MIIAVIPPAVLFVGKLLITAAMVGASYLMQKKAMGKDGRRNANVFTPGDNPTDPTSPIPIVYGRPTWTPPILTDYARSAAVNRWNPDEAAARVTVLSNGAGPMDGGDANYWIDDVPTAEKVDDDSSTSDRTLNRDPDNGRRYIFPKGNVNKESVSIYVDGAFIGAYSAEAGGIDVTAEIEATGTATTKYWKREKGEWVTTTPSLFDSTSTKIGVVLPDQDLVKEDSISVVIDNVNRDLFRFNSDRTGSSAAQVTVPREDVHFETTKDGTRFIWAAFYRSGWGPTNVSRQTKGLGWSITYRLYRKIEIETDTDGTTYAILNTDPGASAIVTANYRAGALDKTTVMTFRPGTADQEALPGEDGVRSTNSVGNELVEGTPVSYSTTNEVDNLEIGIQSGPGGMYQLRQKTGAFRAVERDLAIYLKRSDASDTRSSGNKDIGAGWVRLVSGDGDFVTTIGGQTRGAATWTFDVGKLWTDTVGHNPPRTTLPFAKYDVEVVALDDAIGDPSSDKVYFAYATEIRKDRISLPHHSTTTIEATDPAVLSRNPTYAVSMKGRRVWVPESGATYDSTTRRPEPGAMKWTRNPVWCSCDLIVDPIFGAGQHYTWQNINIAEALTAASFADASVTNADGTTETRSEVDIVLDAQDSIARQVMKILNGSQILAALSGGTWRFLPDVDGDSVMTITTADYRRGEAALTYASTENIPNELVFQFPDEALDFELNADSLVLPGSEPDARVTQNVTYDGVRRRSQAVRAASLALRQNNLQRRTVDLVCSGWRVLLLEAGDIVTATIPELGLTDFKARVQSIEFGSNLTARLRLGEHNPTVYSTAFLGPVGGVVPGHRPLPAGTASLVEIGGKANAEPVVKQTGTLPRFTVTLIAGTTNDA